MRTNLNGVVLICLFVFLGCGKDSNGAQGEEGGECFLNNTCNHGLNCVDNRCVNTSGGTSEDFLTTCLSCGETKCSQEAENCNNSEGCSSLLACWLGCGEDAMCVLDCDTASVGAESLQFVTSFFECIALNCVNECTYSPSDAPIAGSKACDVVVPSGNCESVSFRTYLSSYSSLDNYLGLRPPPDLARQLDPLPTFISNDVLSVTYGSPGINVQWYLDQRQMGAIRFTFVNPVDISRIYFESSPGSRLRDRHVSVETEDGSSGCNYIIDSSSYRLRRIDIVSDSGCWGNYFGYMDNIHPSDLRVVNLYTEPASTNTTVSLSISNVFL